MKMLATLLSILSFASLTMAEGGVSGGGPNLTPPNCLTEDAESILHLDRNPYVLAGGEIGLQAHRISTNDLSSQSDPSTGDKANRGSVDIQWASSCMDFDLTNTPIELRTELAQLRKFADNGGYSVGDRYLLHSIGSTIAQFAQCFPNTQTSFALIRDYSSAQRYLAYRLRM